MKLKIKKPRFQDSKFFSLSTLGALLFAMSLWVYTSLNDIYSTRIDIPLEIELPDSRSPETPLPSTVTIFAKGTGWHLFNLIYFNQKKVCSIDLTSEPISSQNYEIPRSTILKSLRNIVNIVTEDVFPDNIAIITGPSTEKRIPIRNRLLIVPDENFITATRTVFSPDSIIITGNDKVLRDIAFWPTERRVFDGINKPISATVSLKDSLSTIINLSSSITRAQIEIQQLAEITIRDIPINYSGNNLLKNEKLSANKVDITLRGGVRELVNLSFEDISAYINLEGTEDRHIIRPNIILPEQFELLNISPRYIYRYQYENNLAGFQ